jgi:hypothetical protein
MNLSVLTDRVADAPSAPAHPHTANAIATIRVNADALRFQDRSAFRQSKVFTSLVKAASSVAWRARAANISTFI